MPFFHVRYTIKDPSFSSWHISTVSTWSSQLPLGGFHSTCLALAGGVPSSGCWAPPFCFFERFVSPGAADPDCRPRLRPVSAASVCAKSWSLPPIDA